MYFRSSTFRDCRSFFEANSGEKALYLLCTSVIDSGIVTPLTSPLCFHVCVGRAGRPGGVINTKANLTFKLLYYGGPLMARISPLKGFVLGTRRSAVKKKCEARSGVFGRCSRRPVRDPWSEAICQTKRDGKHAKYKS